ncbi:ribbon-helix-helix domain-containing protein [Phaeobacter sp. JH20_02]|uniref:ribbon-helix-helix domain-containing protein n=1 Tax=Phaeobacter sp. JH20_02 TaxID=3112461 RepID=UPI003A861445
MDMPTKIFSFRLDEELIAEVDRRFPKRGERTEFVADAVAEKLGLDTPVKAKMPPIAKRAVAPKPEKSPKGADMLRPDAVVLLAALRKKSMTSRQAKAEMGWLGLRYENAERVLLSEGSAAVVNGVVVPTG